jgi:hypothetical protein
VPSDVDLPITGGCGCGAVRYEIAAPLEGALYCHCTRCQRRTGTAASASAYPKAGTVRVVGGEDRLRSWAPEGGLAKVFCADCGSGLFASDPESGEIMVVRMGTIDGDPGVRPGVRQFVDSAAVWEQIPEDGLPRHSGRMAH